MAFGIPISDENMSEDNRVLKCGKSSHCNGVDICLMSREVVSAGFASKETEDAISNADGLKENAEVTTEVSC
jgi:hypothetical protein